MRKFKTFWHGRLMHQLEFVIDMLVLLASLIIVAQISMYFRFDILFWWDSIIYRFIEYWWIVVIYLLTAVLVFKAYHTSVIYRAYRKTIFNIFISLIWINTVLLIVSLFIGDFRFYIFTSILYIPLAFLIQFLIFCIYKFFAYKLFGKYNKQTVLIIGSSEKAQDLTRQFYSNVNHFKEVKYVVYLDHDDVVSKNLYQYINEVDCVYLCENLSSHQKNLITEHAALQNYKQVFVVPTKMEILSMGASFDHVDDTLVLRAENMHLSFEMRFIKRTIDIIVSSIGLIIALVPMLIVALLVKLQDGGPVFYKQERFKRGNKPFNILKFRSMTHKQSKEEEQQVATRHDARITKIGKFIRATRLDELPQLINVFKSDMSLVGPRPMMKSVMDEATSDNPDFRYRSNVKPGVTGLAQVFGRYDTSPQERLRYDLLYVRKCSLWLDIKIIFLTVMTVLSKDAGLGRDQNLSLDALLKSRDKSITLLDEEGIKGLKIN